MLVIDYTKNQIFVEFCQPIDDMQQHVISWDSVGEEFKPIVDDVYVYQHVTEMEDSNLGDEMLGKFFHMKTISLTSQKVYVTFGLEYFDGNTVELLFDHVGQRVPNYYELY